MSRPCASQRVSLRAPLAWADAGNTQCDTLLRSEGSGDRGCSLSMLAAPKPWLAARSRSETYASPSTSALKPRCRGASRPGLPRPEPARSRGGGCCCPPELPFDGDPAAREQHSSVKRKSKRLQASCTARGVRLCCESCLSWMWMADQSQSCCCPSPQTPRRRQLREQRRLLVRGLVGSAQREGSSDHSHPHRVTVQAAAAGSRPASRGRLR